MFWLSKFCVFTERGSRRMYPHFLRGYVPFQLALQARQRLKGARLFTGHFVRNHRTLASLTDFISQEWKEYAKSDSRYLHSDPFILAVETITAVGPRVKSLTVTPEC